MESKNIIVTGGSGFIGTNIIEFYKKRFNIINIDISKPRNSSHKAHWKEIDILNFSALSDFMNSFKPDYIIHLAAKTDLDGKTIDSYRVNYDGVSNIIKILKNIKTVKRVIFTSSMLVCKRGYIPQSQTDYSPDTLYGKSKVMGEEIIDKEKNLHFESLIIRPTSIWGPWFEAPYLQFFLLIKKNRFFTFNDKMSNKTFGFINDTVSQIDFLLLKYKLNKQNEMFYLGDRNSINIGKWSHQIAAAFNKNTPISIPYFIAKLLSYFGDLLGCFNIKIPLTSFRFKNMTEDQIIDTSKINNLLQNKRYSHENNISETINWIQKERLK